jgi:hypothetical protein
MSKGGPMPRVLAGISKAMLLATLSLVAGVAACESLGTLERIDMQVIFQKSNGEPAGFASVYIIETVGNFQLLTDEWKADKDGVVVLRGDYCVPLQVAAEGGGVVIYGPSVSNKYVVKLVDGPPSLARIFGTQVHRRGEAFSGC